MLPRHAFILCLGFFALANSSQAQGVGEKHPKGLVTLSGSGVTMAKDQIILRSDQVLQGDVTIRITGESHFESAELEASGGRSTVRMRASAAKDLRKEQQISVIAHSDGKHLYLLRAVIAGPRLSGTELALDVDKLGGSVSRPRLPGGKGVSALHVDLSGTACSDADLPLLAQSRDISSLNLSFTRVTDQGVAALSGMTNLHVLQLAGTRITDKALATLQTLGNLDSIDLAQTQISNEGMEKLARTLSSARAPGAKLSLGRVGLGDKAHYRVHEEYEEGQLVYRYLMIGDTYFGRYYVRGTQGKGKDRHREATTYYHRDGPVGQIMGGFEWFQPKGLLDYPSDVRLPASLIGLLAPVQPLPTSALAGLWTEPAFAVIRLNVGTHAAYGRPYQHIDFYDSTPPIETFSMPAPGRPVYFGLVADAIQRGCLVNVIGGDERQGVHSKSPKNFYRAIFVEVTRNDLRDVNTDLLTKEGLADMMACLTENGVLAFHTSHRYYKLVEPIADAAKSLGLAWKVARDGQTGPFDNSDSSHFSSEWLVVARQPTYLQHLTNVRNNAWDLSWSQPQATGAHLWRDGQPHNLKALAR